MKPSILLLGALLLATPLSAQTWHAAGLVGNVLALPGGCASTWYDPEAFLFSDGNRGFLAQGGIGGNDCTAGVGLDSIYRAKHDSSTLTWQLPTPDGCPAVLGTYTNASCPGNEFFAPLQPLASPAVAKVGNKYFMAFSGGNADIRKGHIFWATSNDGSNWTIFKWNPKPPDFAWKPLIYPKLGDVCERFGVAHVQLTYDPGTEYGPEGTFYLHFDYLHSPLRANGELDTYTFRFNYSSANGFGLGGGTQICINSGPRGTTCNWANHSGKMVFDYDNQPPELGDPLLGRFAGNVQNFDHAGGSIVWDPSHNNWLRVFKQFDANHWWQSTTSLSSGTWSAPQMVDMVNFHNQVKARHPSYNNDTTYGGLWWGRVGTRTGMWFLAPADYTNCNSPFLGLGIFTVALNFF